MKLDAASNKQHAVLSEEVARKIQKKEERRKKQLENVRLKKAAMVAAASSGAIDQTDQPHAWSPSVAIPEPTRSSSNSGGDLSSKNRTASNNSFQRIETSLKNGIGRGGNSYAARKKKREFCGDSKSRGRKFGTTVHTGGPADADTAGVDAEANRSKKAKLVESGPRLSVGATTSASPRSNSKHVQNNLLSGSTESSAKVRGKRADSRNAKVGNGFAGASESDNASTQAGIAPNFVNQDANSINNNNNNNDNDNIIINNNSKKNIHNSVSDSKYQSRDKDEHKSKKSSRMDKLGDHTYTLSRKQAKKEERRYKRKLNKWKGKDPNNSTENCNDKANIGAVSGAVSPAGSPHSIVPSSNPKTINLAEKGKTKEAKDTGKAGEKRVKQQKLSNSGEVPQGPPPPSISVSISLSVAEAAAAASGDSGHGVEQSEKSGGGSGGGCGGVGSTTAAVVASSASANGERRKKMKKLTRVRPLSPEEGSNDDADEKNEGKERREGREHWRRERGGGGGGGGVGEKEGWGFEVDYNDHFETPRIAFEDISPLLRELGDCIHAPLQHYPSVESPVAGVAAAAAAAAAAVVVAERSGDGQQLDMPKSGKKRKSSSGSMLLDQEVASTESEGAKEKLFIYDPYFCQGGVMQQLQSMGFDNVINRNRDFYADIKAKNIPEYDILVTNPPYSGEHKAQLLEYLKSPLHRGRPFALLLPAYCANKSYWRDFLRVSATSTGEAVAGEAIPFHGAKSEKTTSKDCSVSSHASPKYNISYILPPDSYDYTHPEGTGKEIPPFYSMWFVGVQTDIAKVSRLRAATTTAAAPEGEGKGKSATMTSKKRKVENTAEISEVMHFFDGNMLLKFPFGYAVRPGVQAVAGLQALVERGILSLDRRPNPKARRKMQQRKSSKPKLLNRD